MGNWAEERLAQRNKQGRPVTTLDRLLAEPSQPGHAKRYRKAGADQIGRRF